MKAKIIGFLVGCLIGGILGGYQIKSWGCELPLGAVSDVTMTLSEAMDYLNENHIDVPIEVENACEHYGREYDISPQLLEAIAWQESRFVDDAVSRDGSCVGLMQVKTSVHRRRMKKLSITDAYDIDNNVHLAADYLSDLREENSDIEWCLNSYNGNGGHGSYAKEVMKTATALEMLTWD